MQFQLGKAPAIFDSRTLAFASYLQPALPTPPSSVDYGQHVGTWPMFGNDQYGDCTCAAAGHMVQNWTTNANKAFTPTDASVLKFYEHFVGKPPRDEGVYLIDALKYWRSNGLDRHKILAFTELELGNEIQAQDALYMFGSIYIGVALPDFAVVGDMLATPWVVPSKGPVGDAKPNPHNGHCIPAVAYDARNLYIVTWGAVKAMSWRFYKTYADEAYAVLSKDFIEKNKQAASGFALATLEQDLSALEHIPSTAATFSRRHV